MKNVLEHLFCSKTRIALLSLFLFNPQREFYVRELTRVLKEQINSIRRELDNLSKIQFVESRERDKRRYYKLNTKFILHKELKALISRANSYPQDKLMKEMKRLGDIKFACLSGFFTQSPSHCDLLVVGKPSHNKIEKLIKKMEDEQNHEINYTIMSSPEFSYRRDLSDRFLKTVLENEYIVLVNEISV